MAQLQQDLAAATTKCDELARDAVQHKQQLQHGGGGGGGGSSTQHTISTNSDRRTGHAEERKAGEHSSAGTSDENPGYADGVEVSSPRAHCEGEDPATLAHNMSTGPSWVLAQAFLSAQAENGRLRDDVAALLGQASESTRRSQASEDSRRGLVEEIQRLTFKREESDEARRFAEAELMSLRKHLDISNGWTAGGRRPVSWRWCWRCSVAVVEGLHGWIGVGRD